ncbi:MAG: hypothetical protein CMJ19_19645 [Phycisphaeraceae bacterium]|nr:hypothetical protein [Phycisphaeraceae bacterium]
MSTNQPPSSQATDSGDTQCAICHAPIVAGEETTGCAHCQSIYHTECWEYNGGCAQYGCEQCPPTEKHSDLEIPVSYWGREEKPCPFCNKTIQAAALRCRHCGTVFDSAKPQDAEQYESDTNLKKRIPAVRKQSIWLFVFCVISCTAPLAAIVGLFWYRANRKVIDKLPALHSAICKIGLGIAWLQSLIILIVALLHSVLSP